MRNFSRLLIPILVALLSWPYLAFSETAKRPPAGKKIFTNEDLEAGRQRYSSTEDPTPSPGQKENSATSKESGTESPGEPKTGEEPKSGTAKSKEELAKADKELKEVKELEVKYQGILAKYEDSYITAQTDFQKQTLQWQIEDTQTHLSRIGEKRKAVEARKESILRAETKPEEVKPPPQ